MNAKRFATLLKQKRTTLNLSQSKVAEQCCLSKPSYNHLERGIRFPSLEVLIRLSHVLKTDPTEFLFAIISDQEDEEYMHTANLLEESPPSESIYQKSFANSFGLLDKYQQKAIVDIIDSLISSSADNIK